MITEVNGKFFFTDSNNRVIEIEEHEYLSKKEYYESNSVGTKARSDKHCEFCGETIIKGTPHDMHHFSPEFTAYAVHKECEKAFMISLIPLGKE